ncbi:PREDICTED: shootin-1-like [Atta cephalotes]|uniref:Uncharacterized protein n=1 Tax=Atta cephalotes TaxID=12957 RepID=A0A158P141_ATTCE|nr:PREDICTED: shootin-1-like [Atta cephalotes]
MNKTEFNIVLSTEPPRTSPNVIHSHIPVPRISATIKAQERCPPKRRGSFEKLGRGTGNVAAQRASFEKLEASVAQLRSRNNNQLLTSSIEMRKSEEKTPVNVCKMNDVARLNRSNSFLESKWKSKYEDSEKRRKHLLQKSEAANKEHVDLEKKYQQLQRENNVLQSQVQEKEQKLLKLRTVSEAVCKEYEQLKHQYDVETNAMHKAMQQASQVQKERNILAHQSALLMAGVGDDPNGRLLTVLQEVESLKRLLEEEQQNHASQIQMLQEKLEEKESNVEFEIVEEKLKLAESELEVVVQRAERAEKLMEELENVVHCLKQKIKELEEKVSKPPPPPLPPPPPPPPMSTISQSSIKLLTKEKLTSAVSDMENMLGITPKKTPTVAQQPAIDDIINQIKGGRFTLKQTDKQREEERKRRQEAESKPPAVSEMLNILGTMRRRAKPIRQSLKFADTAS